VLKREFGAIIFDAGESEMRGFFGRRVLAASVGAFLILRPRRPNTAAHPRTASNYVAVNGKHFSGTNRAGAGNNLELSENHVPNRIRKSQLVRPILCGAADLRSGYPDRPFGDGARGSPGRASSVGRISVSEEVADRRVVADVLLAQDGTPYALRLVQNSRIKEQ